MSKMAATNTQSPGLKTYFKTPEGRYKLQYEKTHPSGLLHYAHGKAVTQVTLAHLKEKPAPQPAPTASLTTGGGGGRLAAAATRLLGAGNGSRTLSFVSGNGTTGKALSGSGRISALASHGVSGSANGPVPSSNYDGKGTYLIFNVGDTLFVSDYNSHDKDPLKAIHFANSNPVCHAFDPEAKEGHDLLIGLSTGDVYSISLRQQLQDPGKKLVGALHYNKDGVLNNSRCTSILWVPGGDGIFIVSHADGNLYIYDKSKDNSGDSSFPAIKDPTQYSVSHAKPNKNPTARWHICQGSINCMSLSADGSYLATVGRDGYLRVFDFAKEQLLCGGKSYYGSSLCCSWSSDGRYILTGGEDDLVQIYSMEDRKVVAWGEGHSSWVSGVAFDSYWSSPSSDGNGENVMYRFGSVGQDTQLLLWDLVMDEIIVPLRRSSATGAGSPTFCSESTQSSSWDNQQVSPSSGGVLHPPPSMRDVPKLSPVVAHRVDAEPLSGLIFTGESIISICREGHLKIWTRPAAGSLLENQSASNPSEPAASLVASKQSSSGKTPSVVYKQ